MIEELVKISVDTSGPKPETDKDWEIIVKTYELWKTFFPNEYSSLIKNTSIIRDEHIVNKGISKEGGALLQHNMEMPIQLENMIKKIFPKFKLDKKTVKRFLKLLPEFSVSNE